MKKVVFVKGPLFEKVLEQAQIQLVKIAKDKLEVGELSKEIISKAK